MSYTPSAHMLSLLLTLTRLHYHIINKNYDFLHDIHPHTQNIIVNSKACTYVSPRVPLYLEAHKQ